MNEASEPTGRGFPLARREFWVSLILALLLSAWPVREGLLDPDRVYMGVDTATVQQPWSGSEAYPAAEPGVSRPRNPALSDQGVLFYPGYRWISRSWRDGDPPLWNPLIYTGVPGLGNSQMGVQDPQVEALVLLEQLGGERAFHWGLSLLAWLRIFASGFGAFLLARCLGLRGPGALLAGGAFALAGYPILWLNHPLGHVPPLLPWVLLGLERIGGPRPFRAMAGTAFALLLAILGGHPETSFYVGAAAGCWALAIAFEDRRQALRGLAALALGTVAAAVSLWPFVEYLARSGAKSVRLHERGSIDLVALGLVLVAAALVVAFRRAVAAANEAPDTGLAVTPADGARDGASRVRAGAWIGGAGLVLALLGCVLLLRARGLPGTAAIALQHDLFGAPGQGEFGYNGPGTYLELASGWLAPTALALALAALLSPGGPLRRRGLAAGLGALAWLLCLETPGLLDLYRHVPEVGLGKTVRFAVVSALLLALLAGEALESAARLPRTIAALVLAVLLGGVLWPGAEPARPARAPVEDADEHVGFVLLPPAELSSGGIPLEGWLRPGLQVDRVRIRVEPVDESGAVVGPALNVPTGLFPELSPEARAMGGASLAAVPDGARFFRADYLSAVHLARVGLWRFTAELFGPDGREPVAERVAGELRLVRERAWSPVTLALALAGLIGMLCLRRPAREARVPDTTRLELEAGAASGHHLLGLEFEAEAPPRTGRLAWSLAALVVLQGLWFVRGSNPASPVEEAFPLTRTEALLAAEQGQGRFFSDPGVLPPSTGLVRGLRALDGYDGMDSLAYNDFRFLALRPDAHGLLGWNPRGVKLGSAAFRLLGVTHLALAGRLDEPGWELVAGPEGDAPQPAEVYLYRATDPLPRAFVVPRAVPPDVIGSQLDTWDPLAVAVVETDYRVAEPFEHAAAEIVSASNNEVRVRAELDGDGLLVLTDQFFPGWTATVNGVPRKILRANALFRGVPLSRGEYEIVFRYEPLSIRLGLWISLAALLAMLGLALWPRR